MTAKRPPAHSICATFLPPRSAACARVSACNTPGSKAAVRLPKGAPLMAKVLLVEPCTPDHAPVARLYHPAPMLAGAWVSRPPPAALAPERSNRATAGIRPWPAYVSARSWRMPSATKKITASLLAANRAGDVSAAGVADAPVNSTSETTSKVNVCVPGLSMPNLLVNSGSDEVVGDKTRPVPYNHIGKFNPQPRVRKAAQPSPPELCKILARGPLPVK